MLALCKNSVIEMSVPAGLLQRGFQWIDFSHQSQMNPSQSGWSLAAKILFADKTYKPHLLETTKLQIIRQGTFEDDFPFPKVEYVSSVEGRC